MAKKWILPEHNPEDVSRLAGALRISEVTALMLLNRGLTEPVAAQRFLQPSLHELQDPCQDPAMTAAARFLLDVIDAGKRITIFGDYDADGICATALLLRCFRFLDADTDFYIPHRIEEGYGLSCEALQELADAGTHVVVTVDCGITAFEEAAFARHLGLELVITDHHPPRDEKPDAAHVLNPKLEPPQAVRFGYEGLAGVGVAFKLMWAIGQQLSEGSRVSEEYRDLLMEALSLVAIGTIADVVPLVGENRVLTHYGLKTLTVPGRPGLKALIAARRTRRERVSARDVAFQLAPRLNAAGRMGDARAAVEMLVTSDERHATDLAQHLEQQNRRRMKAQRKAVQEAQELVMESDQLDRRQCIVLASPDWHLGIVGLVASRLAERFWRPAFIFNTDGQAARGSARSIAGFSVYAALQQCADLLDRFGGHEAAAGLSLPQENLPAFTERMNALTERSLGGQPPTPELNLDGEIRLAALNLDLVREVNMLAPFGRGNPEPLFAACALQLVGNPQIVGSDRRHLALMVRQDQTVLRAICMGKADWLGDLHARRGEPFSLAFRPGIDTYGGRTAIELRVEDMQWAE